MEKNKKILPIFSKCLTCLCFTIFEMEDIFLKKRLNTDIQRLLISFVNFQGGNGTAQHNIHVAQYYKVINQLDYFINTLETLQRLKKIKKTTSLLALKNLFLLKSSILDLNKIIQKPQKDETPKESKTNSTPNKPQINDLEKRIVNFIKENGQPTKNSQLFEKFPKYSSKTIRRNTKSLLLKNLLKSQKKGREVAYAVTLDK